MNIIFLIDNLKGGGAEKAFSLVVERLSLDKNISVELVLLENKIDYSISNNVKITSLSNELSIYNFPLVMYRYYRYIKKRSPSVQFSANMKSHLMSILIGRVVDVITVLNVQFDLTEHYSKRPLFLSFVLYLYQYSDAYCYVSKGVYLNLKKRINNDKPCFIINNPVSLSEISIKIKEPFSPGLLEIFKKRTIVTVGRLTEQKNHVMLLKAFSLIKMDVNLVVVGVGELEKNLRKLSVDLHIDKNVFFIGFHENPYVFVYNSDCFVLSSQYEGFGNVIIEAMACGIPIISTDCNSGPREIISPSSDVSSGSIINKIELSQFGILTPVYDEVELSKAINIILVDEDLSLEYKQLSLKRSHDFDVNTISQLYLEMFEMLTGY